MNWTQIFETLQLDIRYQTKGLKIKWQYKHIQLKKKQTNKKQRTPDNHRYLVKKKAEKNKTEK